MEFRVLNRRLVVKPLLGLFGIAVFVLLISLGNWQSERAEFKERKYAAYEQSQSGRGLDLESAVAMNAEPYTKVWARGRFVADAPLLYLDNRTRRGVHGFQVLAVFEVEALPNRFLVNLGWIAQKASRRDLPQFDLPQGDLELRGLWTQAPSDVFRLGPDEPPITDRQWIIQAVEIDDLAERLGYGLASFVLLLRPEQSFGLVREWKPTYVVTPAKHRGYAFQWYALSVAWVVLLLWVAFRQRDIERAE
ncbi:MAG: SURF1 family protein [Gammaproteobacteria bacterium]